MTFPGGRVLNLSLTLPLRENIPLRYLKIWKESH